MTRVTMLGLTTLDIVHATDQAIGSNEKARASQQFLAAGGPAANAAVIAAALGCEVHLITAIGAHPLGNIARTDLATQGVRVHDVAETAVTAPPLSLARIATASAERSVSSLNDGALLQAMPGARSDDLADLLSDVEAVLVDGYYPRLLEFYEPELTGHRQLVIDVGSWKDSYAPLLGSAACAAASADAVIPGDDDALRALLQRGARLAVTTCGSGAIRLAPQGGETREVLPPSVDAVDTLGAGDAFHGALAASFALSPELEALAHVQRAATVASHRCAFLGPRDFLRSPDFPHFQA